jgi:hypothetical protein
MSGKKSKSSGRGPTPKGHREPDLTPPIPLVYQQDKEKSFEEGDQGQYREEAVLGYWDLHRKHSFRCDCPQETQDGDVRAPRHRECR